MVQAGAKGSKYAVIKRRDGSTQVVDRNTGRIVGGTSPTGKKQVFITVDKRTGGGGRPSTISDVNRKKEEKRINTILVEDAKIKEQQRLANMVTQQSIDRAKQLRALEKARQQRARNIERNAYASLGASARVTRSLEEQAKGIKLEQELLESKVISPSFRRSLGVFTKKEQEAINNLINQGISNNPLLKKLSEAQSRNIKSQQDIDRLQKIIEDNVLKLSIIPPKYRNSFASQVIKKYAGISATALLRLGASASYGIDTARSIIIARYGSNTNNRFIATATLNSLNKQKGQLTVKLANDIVKSMNPRTPEGVANILFALTSIYSLKGFKKGGSAGEKALAKGFSKKLRNPTFKNYVKKVINTNVLLRLLKKKQTLSKLTKTRKAGFPEKIKTSTNVSRVLQKRIDNLTKKDLFIKSKAGIERAIKSIDDAKLRALLLKDLFKARTLALRNIASKKIRTFLKNSVKKRLDKLFAKEISKTIIDARLNGVIQIQIKIVKKTLIGKIDLAIKKFVTNVLKEYNVLALKGKVTKIKFERLLKRNYKQLTNSINSFFTDPFLKKFVNDIVKKISRKQFKARMKIRKIKKTITRKQKIIKQKTSKIKTRVVRKAKRPIKKLNRIIKARLSRLGVPKYVTQAFNKLNLKRYLRNYERSIDAKIRKEIKIAKTVAKKRGLRSLRKRFKQSVDRLLDDKLLDNIVNDPRGLATKLSKIKEAEALLSEGAIFTGTSATIQKGSKQTVLRLSIDSSGKPTVTKTSVIAPKGRVITANEILKKTSGRGGQVQSQRQVLLLKQKTSKIKKPLVKGKTLIVRTANKKILKFKSGNTFAKQIQVYARTSLLINNSLKNNLRARIIIPAQYNALDKRFAQLFINGQVPAQAKRFLLGKVSAQAQARSLAQSRAVIQRLNSVLRQSKLTKTRTLVKILKKPKLSSSDKEYLKKFVRSAPVKYRPSLSALLYGITAYKIPKSITGFEIRPIIIKKKRKTVKKRKK